MTGSLIFSWGSYGGFYYHRGLTRRLCLGWVAFTFLPVEIDELHREAMDEIDELRERITEYERAERTRKDRERTIGTIFDNL